MSRKITETGRYRLFFLELYHDTTSYDYKEVLRILKSMGKYAYIVHDKDIYSKEDYDKYISKYNKEPSFHVGDHKKVHTHFILKRENAMTGSAFVKKTGIPLNFCEEIQNERSCCRYLLHTDDEDKFQYNKNEVKCSKNYEREFFKCFTELENEETQLTNIYLYIDKQAELKVNRHNALFNLIIYVNSNCYDTIYKRYRYEIKDYLQSVID